jgi:hypothetical protein
MPRESGHPVLRDDEIELIRHGVLDHPLSRMMTSEQATSFPVIASASEAIHGAVKMDCFVAALLAMTVVCGLPLYAISHVRWASLRPMLD